MMNRVLTSADILKLIISVSDDKTQARCARVCKLWFDPAARSLWYSLQLGDVESLFSLLPAVKCGEGKVICYNVSSAESWDRFSVYAKHIKHLILDCSQNNPVHETLKRLAYSRPTSCLLPNLDDLEVLCGDHLMNPVYFLSTSLKRLSVHGINNPTDTYTLLSLILPRAPKLASLRVDWTGHVSPTLFEKDVVLAFNALKYLEDLTITRFYLGDSVLCALAEAHDLKRLQYSFGLGKQTFDAPKITQSAFNKIIVPFSSLETVSINLNGDMTTQFLSLDFHCSKINTLEVKITDKVTETSLHSCCRTLALNWYTLEHLILKINQTIEVTNSTNNIFKFDKFLLLSGLRDLHSFVLHCTDPLFVTDKDIERLVENWSQMKRSELHSDPRNISVTLSSLISFSKYCPDIRYLSLPVDATKAVGLPSGIDPLKNLEVLDFGLSSIRDPNYVALFLSRICTSKCRLSLERKFGVSGTSIISDDASGPTDTTINVEETQKNWLQVSQFLELILKALDYELGRL